VLAAVNRHSNNNSERYTKARGRYTTADGRYIRKALKKSLTGDRFLDNEQRF
jgi:hypothetical protein